MSYAATATLNGNAVRAYQASAGHRSLREQEADVFRRASYVLRACAKEGQSMARIRALADNRRLWGMVMDLVRDPANQLPVPVRANLVSIGLAVVREMDGEEPDLAFLADVNDQIAAGLAPA